jgi:hypothetical protein
MLIPVAIYLYAFYGFLVFWVVMSFIALFHLLTFGIKNMVTFFAASIYIVISVLVITTTFTSMQPIEWQTPINELPNIDISAPLS